MKRALLVCAFLFASTACTQIEIDRFVNSTESTKDVLTEAQLARLRDCESTNNYEAVSPSGTYRGAYQFDQTTWDDVAGRHYHWLEGMDPIEAEFFWQDAMTRALFSERGAQPWPVCGKRI
jgi:hypothetical protein